MLELIVLIMGIYGVQFTIFYKIGRLEQEVKELRNKIMEFINNNTK